MGRAGVPETPVDEDRYLGTREDDVWVDADAGRSYQHVPSESKSLCKERGAESKFDLGISATVADAHFCRRLGRWLRIWNALT